MILTLFIACAVRAADGDLLNEPPKGWTDLRDIPGLRLDIGYHRADNFTGAPLPGYGAPGAWMLTPVAEQLARVHAELQAQGLGLLVYDAYRPLRGTLAMVAWAERTGQVALLDNGYIARRSRHNHGTTVDLTIARLPDGPILDMGTPWDTLDERAHTQNAQGEVLQNRLLLKNTMKKYGFEPYSKEWWHFQYTVEGSAPRDVPYGCFEAPEGQWKAPEGWNQPGFQMPLEWGVHTCP